MDPAHDLVRFGARDYAAQWGRFLAPDPMGFLGGGRSLYVYANNDPVNLGDPTGNIPVLIAEAGIEALLTGGSLFTLMNDNIFGNCDNGDENMGEFLYNAGSIIIPGTLGARMTIRLARLARARKTAKGIERAVDGAKAASKGVAEVADGVPKMSGMLRDAAKGKGNFGIGGGTREQAAAMGRAWVGDGYKVASDGKTLISADGMRQYRPPSYKPSLGKVQANFERRFDGQATKRWQGNAHLDITD